MRTYPSDGSSNASLNSAVEVSFSGPIDTSAVRGAFSVTPAVPGYFQNYYESSSFTFYPLDGFLATTTYTVTIDTSMRSNNGTKLFSPYNFTLTTEPFLVTSSFPRHADVDVPRTQNISLFFNANIDTSSIGTAFSIIPRVQGYFISYERSSYFYPSTSLSARTTYSVTVSTAMRAKGGSHLSSPYAFSFTTGD